MTAAGESASTDSPEGCRTHAEQDRIRADAMDTDNGRLRLRRSAAAWDVRADEMEALAGTEEARRAMARSEWEEADRVEAMAGSRKGLDDDAE